VNWGKALRDARQRQGFSLDDISAQTGISKGHLSRIERGQRPATPDIIRRYEQVLGCPVAATLPGLEAGTVDDVKRRQLLASIAAASVGAAAPELDRIIDTPPTPPARVGLGDVEAVEQAARLCMSVDLTGNGRMIAAMARGALEYAHGLAEGRMTDTVRQRLATATALLADRLGWAVFDSGQAPRAVGLLTYALNVAANGPDRDLWAHTMLDLSSVLAHMGRPADAVETLRLALGDERVSSAEVANLHAVAARHSATAGDVAGGLRHVERALEALGRDQPADAPDWAQQITYAPGHHDAALGLALAALGQDERARAHLSAALDRLPSGRTRTSLRCIIRLAALDLRAGDRDGARQRAEQALQRAAAVRSTRITADLAMLAREAAEHGARDLADELTGAASR